jgi:single-strand DNA-binding protein
MAVGRYTLAVNRRFKKDGEESADFISCVCFGKSAEIAEQYMRKGMRIGVCGRIQTGSYTNKDGNKVYTTDVYVEECEFLENKKDGEQAGEAKKKESAYTQVSADDEGFMQIPDGLEDELPFM